LPVRNPRWPPPRRAGSPASCGRSRPVSSPLISIAGPALAAGATPFGAAVAAASRPLLAPPAGPLAAAAGRIGYVGAVVIAALLAAALGGRHAWASGLGFGSHPLRSRGRRQGNGKSAVEGRSPRARQRRGGGRRGEPRDHARGAIRRIVPYRAALSSGLSLALHRAVPRGPTRPSAAGAVVQRRPIPGVGAERRRRQRVESPQLAGRLAGRPGVRRRRRRMRRAAAARWLGAAAALGMFVVLLMGAAVTTTGSGEGAAAPGPSATASSSPPTPSRRSSSTATAS
jgi:hypothetical protein